MELLSTHYLKALQLQWVENSNISFTKVKIKDPPLVATQYNIPWVRVTMTRQIPIRTFQQIF